MLIDSFELEGQDDLRAKLRSLEQAIHDRLAREAVKAAGDMFLSRMRSAAPDSKTRQAVELVIRTYRDNQVTVALIGPAMPFGAHAATIEESHPFVIPTYEELKGRAISVLSSKLSAALQ